MDRIRHAIGRLLHAAMLVALLLGLAATPGCGGCTSTPSDEARLELEKLKEKPKPPFNPLRVIPEPSERYLVPEPKKRTPRANESLLDTILGSADDEEKSSLDKPDDIIARVIKPGHFTGVLVHAKANNFDFSGELDATATNQRQKPLPLEGSSVDLVTSRPSSLPKGQAKVLETIFFAPPAPPNQPRTTTWMSNRLVNQQRGGLDYQEPEVLRHMPDYQYFMLVLSRDSNRFRYLRVLESIRPPVGFVPSVAEDAQYYRVLCPKADEPLALASHPLCWSNLAHVVWDEVRPTALTPEQQLAMLDWLHWGGSLIVSGPQTLDMLAGSFLDPFLPVTNWQSLELDAAALAPLGDHWTVPSAEGARPLDVRERWSGLKLTKHADAQFLAGSGELVAERRIGRGRVLVTGFRLSQRELLNWRSFDSFVSVALLHRPPRRYDAQHDTYFFFEPGNPTALDSFSPRLVTNINYFTRDSWENKPPWELRAVSTESQPAVPTWQYRNSRGGQRSDDTDATRSASGPGGWSDSNWVATTVRGALQSAARISVPDRQFVLWMLGAYLVVLVPLNWLVFRAIGRVEWAWVAVPVLAVGWGIAVIRLAQLDIGFARSETEIAILELQNDYSRGHLTRYSALYSSLTTTYAIALGDRSSLAMPFSNGASQYGGQEQATVKLNSADGCRLSDFIVKSNSTGMIHSEQMFDVGGPLEYRQIEPALSTLTNHTSLRLSGAAIVRRLPDVDNKYASEAAWLGELKPGQSVDVRFVDADAAEIDARREAAPLTCEEPPEGELNLRSLLDLAQSVRLMQPGDVRLVAWRDDAAGPAGIEVTPSCSQSRRATVVVANLHFAAGPPPTRDISLRTRLSFDDDGEQVEQEKPKQ